MVSSWTYALLFVCSQYTKTIAKEFITKKKKQGEEELKLSQGQKPRERTRNLAMEIDGLVVF